MNSDRCIKEECQARTVASTTIYWCDDCNIPVFDKVCDICGKEARYISTDIRPVFPEEKLLLSIILEKEDPLCFDNASIWNGSGAYFIDGQKLKIQINKLNKLPLDDIIKIKEKYFNEIIDKFIKANQVRYNNINDEAAKFIQGYLGKYSIEDMLVSFSGVLFI
jgi:phosphoadenosine phosphosulfate reductase